MFGIIASAVMYCVTAHQIDSREENQLDATKTVY